MEEEEEEREECEVMINHLLRESEHEDLPR